MADPPPDVVATKRLTLRRITRDDAPYILELLNEASFRQHIGDKGVDSLAEATRYIDDVPVAHYRAYGYGAYLAVARRSRDPVGMCGLYQRSNLDVPDLGFALSERHQGKGLASEAARGVLGHARTSLGLSRVAAIVDPDNERSIRLLLSLGFDRRGRFRLPDEDHDLDYYERGL